MARTLYPVQSPATMDWSDSTWALADGGAANEPKPVDGDTVITTLNSGDVTLDEDAPATGGLAAFTLNIVGIFTGGDFIITATDVTHTAGSLDTAGSLNVTMVETGDIAWNSTGTHRLGTVTFSGTTTAGDAVYCQKVAGDGTIAGNSEALWVYPAANDFWTLSTESAGWNPVRFIAAASRSNATLIELGASPFVQYFWGTTLTLTGGLACGTVTLQGSNGAHTFDMDGGDLTCTTFKFDEDDGTFLAGEGNIVITGVIERVAAEHGCSIDFETSHVTLGGNVTLAFAETDGAVDFGSAVLAGAGITMDGASATSLVGDGGRFSNMTIQNMAEFCAARRWRCRGVTEGAGVAQALLHLDRYPRGRPQRFRCHRNLRV